MNEEQAAEQDLSPEARAAVKVAVSDVLDDVEDILQAARCGEGDGDLRSVISKCNQLRAKAYPLIEEST